MSDFKEFDLINWIRKLNKDSGIGDDTAILNIPQNNSLLVTSDMLVEDTHFIIDRITPYQLGHKTLAVNLSDIAAMGGWPCYGILSACWSKKYKKQEIEEFFHGFISLAEKYQVKLVGGDTCKGEKIALDLCLLGEILKGKEVTRSKAEEGDYILISGPLGSSAAGLELILKNSDIETHEKELLLNAHFMPEAKVLEGYEIGDKELASAMIDVSDGLASEINHIAKESKVGAIIYEEKIPMLEPVKKLAKSINKDPLQWALQGGEDYQLLMSVKEENVEKVIEIIERYKNNYTSTLNQPVIIGRILEKSNGVKIKKGKELLNLHPEGYTHF